MTFFGETGQEDTVFAFAVVFVVWGERGCWGGGLISCDDDVIIINKCSDLGRALS